MTRRRPHGWPRLDRDAKGLRVRLLRDIETNGGALFPAGSCATVVGMYRGRATLSIGREMDVGHGYVVGVHTLALEIVGGAP